MDIPPVGSKCRAGSLSGRNLQFFEDKMDLKWLRDTHANDTAIQAALQVNPEMPSFSPLSITGAIITGNEDSPEQIWLTDSVDPNNLDTFYFRVA